MTPTSRFSCVMRFGSLAEKRKCAGVSAAQRETYARW
jgi:hypothetical protein